MPLSYYLHTIWHMKTYIIKENQLFTGRAKESLRLEQISTCGESSILAVYGRRRVGKTELIEHCFRKRNILKFEGVESKDENFQKRNFLLTLANYTEDFTLTKLDLNISWQEIFEILASRVKTGKWTIYFEELQWMANYKPDLITELKPIWDNHLRHNPNIVLVLCGSSPSFFISNVIRSRALHNRSMYELKLEEFPIEEAASFYKKKSLKELFNAYLLVGGIPQYLKLLNKESSAYLGICNNSFKSNSFFSTEYDRILVSSFAHSELFQKIISFIGTRNFTTRNEILKFLKHESSGGITDRLQELELCGFIRSYAPLGSKAKTRSLRYEIADPYLRFYFRNIQPRIEEIQKGEFDTFATKPLPLTEYTKLLGLSFEQYCRKNSAKIAEKLGFAAVEYTSGAHYQRSDQRSKSSKAAPRSQQSNFQIDLMYQRKDRVWVICEVKYQETPVNQSIISEFEEKLAKLKIPKSISIYKVLISASGAASSLTEQPYFDRILTLEDLI